MPDGRCRPVIGRGQKFIDGGLHDWGAWVMASPDGYILSTPDGRVFLDATVMHDRKAIWMSQILCDVQGEGLGSRVMEAIHDHAVENGLDLVVFKVTNAPFFDRFE